MNFAFRKRRSVLALLIAVVLALPTIIRPIWNHDVVALVVTILNLPGILFVGRHYPPEGFPGESPLHVFLMLLIQSVVWLSLLRLIRFRNAR